MSIQTILLSEFQLCRVLTVYSRLTDENHFEVSQLYKKHLDELLETVLQIISNEPALSSQQHLNDQFRQFQNFSNNWFAIEWKQEIFLQLSDLIALNEERIRKLNSVEYNTHDFKAILTLLAIHDRLINELKMKRDEYFQM